MEITPLTRRGWTASLRTSPKPSLLPTRSLSILKIALLPRAILLLAAFPLLVTARPASSQTLYSQSLQAALAPLTTHLEVLLYDLPSNTVQLNSFAPGPIPPGSLLKPLLAAAYARTHSAFPLYPCPGHSRPLPLPQALAESSNPYFLALAAHLDPTRLQDLPAPPSNDPRTLIGLTPDWLLPPTAIVQAYARLLTSSSTPPEILTGMRLAATRGTAWRLGRHPGGLLAKTGTAPCRCACLASGDGLVLIAGPALHPTHLLLVRKRGTTGAMTAAAASPILLRLESLHAW